MTTSFGQYELKLGDNDGQNIWGGQKLQESGDHVTRLQKALKAAGIPLGQADGAFGTATQRAVKMFQWCATSHPYRINNQSVIMDTQSPQLPTSGCLSSQTAQELTRWLGQKYMATGDLVRISLNDLAHIELGAGFRRLAHPSIRETDLVISAGAKDLILVANRLAGQHSVKLVLNQSVRVAGQHVSGAVVTPATRSQHLIGHAIDCNIVDGSRWNNSADFLNRRQSAAADAFISNMKAAGFRWGGEFSNPDTPHFDKQVAPHSETYNYKYYFNQRSISNPLPIPLKAV